jgi:hypothetical protein
MNERIKELYTKAYCVAFDEADDKNFLDHHMEKFAELIVRECAGLFEIEWGDEKLTGNDVGYVVKKHFGVTEE